jgi:hypothetical protein
LKEEDASIALFYGQNKMKKLVHGIGINDADYVVNPTINSKKTVCHFYSAWKSMLRRCYSTKFQIENPTYIDCTVCEEWYSFMSFRAWMIQQNWHGKQLDKDLLFLGNKIYSPDACIFVSLQINTLLADSGASRGEFPIGASWHIGKGEFQALCRTNGKLKHLGYFTNFHAAHRAWQQFKIKVIQQAAAGQADTQLVAALNRIADKIQSDYELNIETTCY